MEITQQFSEYGYLRLYFDAGDQETEKLIILLLIANRNGLPTIC